MCLRERCPSGCFQLSTYIVRVRLVEWKDWGELSVGGGFSSLEEDNNVFTKMLISLVGEISVLESNNYLYFPMELIKMTLPWKRDP